MPRMSGQKRKPRGGAHVGEAGAILREALRTVYHYPCGQAVENKLSALVVAYLFTDQLLEQLFADIEGELGAGRSERHPADVIDQVPEAMRDLIEDFMEEHVFHGDEARIAGFNFQQLGIGVA